MEHITESATSKTGKMEITEAQWRGFLHIWAWLTTMPREEARRLLRAGDRAMMGPIAEKLNEKEKAKLGEAIAENALKGLEAIKDLLMALRQAGEIQVIAEDRGEPTPLPGSGGT